MCIFLTQIRSQRTQSYHKNVKLQNQRREKQASNFLLAIRPSCIKRSRLLLLRHCNTIFCQFLFPSFSLSKVSVSRSMFLSLRCYAGFVLRKTIRNRSRSPSQRLCVSTGMSRRFMVATHSSVWWP